MAEDLLETLGEALRPDNQNKRSYVKKETTIMDLAPAVYARMEQIIGVLERNDGQALQTLRLILNDDFIKKFKQVIK